MPARFQSLVDLAHGRHPVVQQMQNIQPQNCVIAFRGRLEPVHVGNPEGDIVNASRRPLVLSDADHLR